MRGRRTRARDTCGIGRCAAPRCTPTSSVRGSGGAAACFVTATRFVASTTTPYAAKPRPPASPAVGEPQQAQTRPHQPQCASQLHRVIIFCQLAERFRTGTFGSHQALTCANPTRSRRDSRNHRNSVYKHVRGAASGAGGHREIFLDAQKCSGVSRNSFRALCASRAEKNNVPLHSWTSVRRKVALPKTVLKHQATRSPEVGSGDS